MIRGARDGSWQMWERERNSAGILLEVYWRSAGGLLEVCRMSTGVSTGSAKGISARRGLRKPRAGVGLLSTRRTKCQLPTPFARGAKMDDLYVFHPKVAEYDGSWAQRPLSGVTSLSDPVH